LQKELKHILSSMPDELQPIGAAYNLVKCFLKPNVGMPIITQYVSTLIKQAALFEEEVNELVSIHTAEFQDLKSIDLRSQLHMYSFIPAVLKQFFFTISPISLTEKLHKIEILMGKLELLHLESLNNTHLSQITELRTLLGSKEGSIDNLKTKLSKTEGSIDNLKTKLSKTEQHKKKFGALSKERKIKLSELNYQRTKSQREIKTKSIELTKKIQLIKSIKNDLLRLLSNATDKQLKDIALHSIYFNRNNLAENSTEQNQEGDSPTISKSKDLLGYKKLGTTFDKLTYGYLNKQGQQRKNWKKRIFILISYWLFYYANENDVTPKGILHVVDADAKRTDEKEYGKKYCFYVKTNKRTLVCQASNESECLAWVEHIRAAASALN